jgi:hypothetical protein
VSEIGFPIIRRVFHKSQSSGEVSIVEIVDSQDVAN